MRSSIQVFERKYYTDRVSRIIALNLKREATIKVLEAGCGSTSHLRFPPNTEITGIDVSEEQLNKNRGLSNKILGDIQSLPLSPCKFDAVVCSDVLEHLQNPIAALLNMFRTLKPGGIIVLSFPNLISFKGLITKFTFFWIHKSYYKILGYAKSPFPTFFRYAIRPTNIRAISLAMGFSVILYELYGGVPNKVQNRQILAFLFQVSVRFLNLLSMKNLNFANSECIMVLKKSSKQSPRQAAGIVY